MFVLLPLGAVLRVRCVFDTFSGNTRCLRISGSENGLIKSSWTGTRRVPGVKKGEKLTGEEHGVEHGVSQGVFSGTRRVLMMKKWAKSYRG